MFIITINGRETDGAYSVRNDQDEQILYLFEEEDDAVRYAMMLEDNGAPEMHVIEIDDDLMLRTCDVHGYQYAIITKNDIVIPPDTENDFI